MPELILYTTDDGQTSIKLRAEDGTVWLSQQKMAELFASSKQNISHHVRSILAEGEQTEATVKEYLTVQNEGGRSVRRKTMVYSLPLILAVGYRVPRHRLGRLQPPDPGKHRFPRFHQLGQAVPSDRQCPGRGLGLAGGHRITRQANATVDGKKPPKMKAAPRQPRRRSCPSAAARRSR